MVRLLLLVTPIIAAVWPSGWRWHSSAASVHCAFGARSAVGIGGAAASLASAGAMLFMLVLPRVLLQHFVHAGDVFLAAAVACWPFSSHPRFFGKFLLSRMIPFNKLQLRCSFPCAPFVCSADKLFISTIWTWM
jgi:hypothetical protein